LVNTPREGEQRADREHRSQAVQSPTGVRAGVRIQHAQPDPKCGTERASGDESLAAAAVVEGAVHVPVFVRGGGRRGVGHAAPRVANARAIR
jgi:hypothetical protein